jgi:hypothetical protein
LSDQLDLDAAAALLRERKKDLEQRIGDFAKPPERGTIHVAGPSRPRA